eukprot:PhF_6_TR26210/c0_g1_i5/m.37350
MSTTIPPIPSNLTASPITFLPASYPSEVYYFYVFAIAGPFSLYILFLILALSVDIGQDQRFLPALPQMFFEATQYDYKRTSWFTLYNYKNFQAVPGLGTYTLKRHLWISVFQRKPLNTFGSGRRLVILFCVVYGPPAIIGWFYDNIRLTTTQATDATSASDYSVMIKMFWVGCIAAGAVTVVSWGFEEVLRYSRGKREEKVLATYNLIRANMDPSKAVLFESEWMFSNMEARFPYHATVCSYVSMFALQLGSGAALWYTTDQYNTLNQVYKYCGTWAMSLLLHMFVFEPFRLFLVYLITATKPLVRRNPDFDYKMDEFKFGGGRGGGGRGAGDYYYNDNGDRYSADKGSGFRPVVSYADDNDDTYYDGKGATFYDYHVPSGILSEMQSESVFGHAYSDVLPPLRMPPPLPRRVDMDDAFLNEIEIVNTARMISQRKMCGMPLWPMVDEERESVSNQQSLDLINSLRLQEVPAGGGALRYVINGHPGITPGELNIEIGAPPVEILHEYAHQKLPGCFRPVADVDEPLREKDLYERVLFRGLPESEERVPPPPSYPRPPPPPPPPPAAATEEYYDDAFGAVEQSGFFERKKSRKKMRDSGDPMGTLTSNGSEVSNNAAIMYRGRVQAMFTKYAPEKLPELNVIMEKFQGNEEELMQALVDKYGPEPMPSGSMGGDDPPMTPLSPFSTSPSREGGGGDVPIPSPYPHTYRRDSTDIPPPPNPLGHAPPPPPPPPPPNPLAQAPPPPPPN